MSEHEKALSTYRVNEVFKSIQGEGARSGTVNVFVRFSGCNLRCSIEPSDKSPGGFDCDTEFASGRTYTLGELYSLIKQVDGKTPCKAVIFTGGEPFLQLDAALLVALRRDNYLIAVETNGSMPIPEGVVIDYLVVSPKVAEHCVRVESANEIRYVRATTQAIPKPSCSATHRYISPAWGVNGISTEDLEWCKQLVMENPEWMLSLQTHKFMRAR